MLERTLPTVWVLHGRDVPALAGVVSRAHAVVVDDAEQLCASLVIDVSRSGAPYVRHVTSADLYEALGFLIGRILEIAPAYDPNRGRAVHDPFAGGFRGWLHQELRRDLIDHWRSRFGREGQKFDLLDLRPFDREEAHHRAHQLDVVDPLEDGSDSFADRRVSALEGFAADDPDGWLDGRSWLDVRRDRKAARQVEAVGFGAPRGAEGGDRAADGIDAGLHAEGNAWREVAHGLGTPKPEEELAA